MLGKGTFGQVVKCSMIGSNDMFAVKVIKNRPAYFHQAKTEILLLRVLNKQESEQQQKSGQKGENYTNRIVKLVDFFVFRNHFCLVFEMLELSLYDYLKNTKFCGFSFSLIAQWTKSILEGMVIAESKQIIHCDLKPENIMLKNNQLRIIDFGSACHKDNRIYTYIQSRFYRAPEVILGMKYTIAIDIWSLGCILVELFLGLPIFPGNSEYDQMKRIIDILGKPTNDVIEEGRFRLKFFNQLDCGEYIFKTKQEFEEQEKVQLKESKNYFSVSCLTDLKNYMMNSQFRRNDDDIKNNKQFELFLDLANQLLELDPKKRIVASDAINHPFLNQDHHNILQFENNEIRELNDQNVSMTKNVQQKANEGQEKIKLNQMMQDQQQVFQFPPNQMQQVQTGAHDQNQQGVQFNQVYNQQFISQQQIQNGQYNYFTSQQGQFPIQNQQQFYQKYPQQYPQNQNQYINQFMQPNQQQSQPQYSQEQLNKFFNQQLILNTQQQQQPQIIPDQTFNTQQNKQQKSQKLQKKSLSQQDSLDYQKEFYDDYSSIFPNQGFPDSVLNSQYNTNQKINMQFPQGQMYQNQGFNQSNYQQGNYQYNYNCGVFNPGFQQGISSIENYSDQQKPPAIIKDIFESNDNKYQIQNQNQKQQIQQQQNISQQQQYLQQQYTNFSQQPFQNMYNYQQQQGVIGNNYALPMYLYSQQITKNQNQMQQSSQEVQTQGLNQYFQFQMQPGYSLFNQQTVQQTMMQQGYQQNQQQIQQTNQNQQSSGQSFQQNLSNQQQQTTQEYQNDRKSNKIDKNFKQGSNNKNFQQSGRNNINNSNYANQQQSSNNSNQNNNSQKSNQSNKKFRRHKSDSQFQQYSTEQNSLFVDIQLPFIQPEQSQQICDDGTTNIQTSEDKQKDDQQNIYQNQVGVIGHGHEKSQNNNKKNQKSNQNQREQGITNHNSNQSNTNQNMKNSQKQYKKNQNIESNISSGYNNQNIQNHNNYTIYNSNINTNNNNNFNNNQQNQQQNNLQTAANYQNEQQKIYQQQYQQQKQDTINNNSNMKKLKNKFENSNKKEFINQKYQQQQVNQQIQKPFTPITESPSQS